MATKDSEIMAQIDEAITPAFESLTSPIHHIGEGRRTVETTVSKDITPESLREGRLEPHR